MADPKTGFIDPGLLKLVPLAHRDPVIASRLSQSLASSIDFKGALSKLSVDTRYRQLTLADPAKIQSDFNLSIKDLSALREAALLSGADMTKIDATIRQQGGNVSDVNVDIDHCCCCCCCCGETAALSLRS